MGLWLCVGLQYLCRRIGELHKGIFLLLVDDDSIHGPGGAEQPAERALVVVALALNMDGARSPVHSLLLR